MRKVYIIFLALVLLALPSPVFAHAIGQLCTLPLPVWLYLYGGAAAVLISFVLIGLFVGRTNHNPYHLELSGPPQLIQQAP